MKSIDFLIAIFLLVFFVSACNQPDTSKVDELRDLRAKVANLQDALAKTLEPCPCGGNCKVCDCQFEECKSCGGTCDCKKIPAEPPAPTVEPAPPAAVVEVAPPAAPACSTGNYSPRPPRFRGIFRRR